MRPWLGAFALVISFGGCDCGGSNGNGRPLDKDGKYKGNSSPIHLFSLPT